MYKLEVESQFSAAHAIVIQGKRETLHGHDWHVTATITGTSIDADGLLCDFHAIESALRAITGRFHNQNLNETEPFDRVNPTAELVAKHIADALVQALVDVLPESASIESVRITEAPGCAATYCPKG